MKLIITEFSAFLHAEHLDVSIRITKGECSSNYFQCSGENCSRNFCYSNYAEGCCTNYFKSESNLVEVCS